MTLRQQPASRQSERMSNLSFRMMTLFFRIVDLFYPHVARRVSRFGLEEGMTVVDYGCGPGRYTVVFARVVGEQGKVFAVDIHELAIEAVRKEILKRGLGNVEPVLARGYDSTLPDQVADRVLALDMFFGIREPTPFLAELKRLTKPDGLLIIDDGHQSRQTTREKVLASELWDIVQETPDHLKCRVR